MSVVVFISLNVGCGNRGNLMFNEKDENSFSSLSCTTSATKPGYVAPHRLNRAEYNNMIRDVFGVNNNPASALPEDGYTGNFTNIASALGATPFLTEKYLSIASQVVSTAFTNNRLSIMFCDPATVTTCTRQIIERFGRKLYRRPLTTSEVTEFLALINVAVSDGDTVDAGVGLALQRMLISPNFLYRVVPAQSGGVDLDQYALASRLSFFIWSSGPDDTLLNLAAAGNLRASLRTQITRMLADPKSNALVSQFASNWLGLNQLALQTPDPTTYTGFSEGLRASMQQETELMLSHVIRNDLNLSTLLDADFSFMNQQMAEHYGITGVSGSNFRQVTYQGDRRGILSHASVLTYTSNPDRTSIVRRGKWVLQRLLCAEPPPPPPEVIGQLPPPDVDMTLRERMELHRANPRCYSCHATMDPIGFGLENFDGIGRWRTLDGSQPIDSSGRLPTGQSFSGPAQLASILKSDSRFNNCVTENLMSYAVGRLMSHEDSCVVRDIAAASTRSNQKFSDLVWAVVNSIPFQRQGAR